MTETLPAEGRIEMVTSRTGMKKARGEGTFLYGLYGDAYMPLDRGMVFELSVLNRVDNFERVCSNCKQGIGCTIDLYDMLDKICVSCKYTKQGTLICSIAIANIKLL